MNVSIFSSCCWISWKNQQQKLEIGGWSKKDEQLFVKPFRRSWYFCREKTLPWMTTAKYLVQGFFFAASIIATGCGTFFETKHLPAPCFWAVKTGPFHKRIFIELNMTDSSASACEKNDNAICLKNKLIEHPLRGVLKADPFRGTNNREQKPSITLIHLRAWKDILIMRNQLKGF